jgi:sn-glycerol 3-phosphate transport system ATP-binding protein
MKDGMIEQIGKPMDIYRHPKSLFVASFIGSPPMNILKAHPNFKEKTIGVRPEHLGLTSSDKSAISFCGMVELVEPLGGETLIHVKMGEENLVVRLNADHQFLPASQITFYAPMDCIQYFEV